MKNIKRTFQIKNLPPNFEAIKAFFSEQNTPKDYKKRFSVKIGEHIKIINTDEIECVLSENKGTYIHTFDNRNYLIDITMDVVESELNPEDFFRANRKFIVQMKAVKDIIVYSNSRLKIMTPTFKNEEIIVARERVPDFKKWIG